jgi:hypothetical protein
MKQVFEEWRRFLKEGLEDLNHISAKPWGSAEAKHEWGEEIKTSLDEGDEYIGQRWPGLKLEIIKQNYPFMLSAEDFAAALSGAPIKNLSLSQMKDIHNHAQVYDIIEMYEKDKSSEEVEKDMFKFFKGHTTDQSASGKTYPKESSYKRWVDKFAKSGASDKPPIVLELPNGKLAHVGGQTRQTGALTNKKIIPYAVLSPVKGGEK